MIIIYYYYYLPDFIDFTEAARAVIWEYHKSSNDIQTCVISILLQNQQRLQSAEVLGTCSLLSY